jgi:GNAT superfamily N-acetyltransferase
VSALAALDANYLDASRLFVAYSARGEYVERRDVALVCCGLPAESQNWGFLKPAYADAVATAEAVQAYFGARGLPYRLVLRADARELLAALEAAGWRRRYSPTPGMTLALPAAIPPARAPLAVREVRTPEELVAFREVAFRGFGYPVAAARLFLDERLLARPGVRLYAGFAGEALVATSLLVATGEVAGIFWVATLEEHRGRGYGEALTWAAIAGGREYGCRVASLQASEAGRRVYSRMGFAHVLDYETLLPPEA